MLDRTLAAIKKEEVLAVDCEVVLVNNGSTDNTREVLDSFAQSSPFRVILVDEPRRGLGRARNAGLAVASGDTILFSDDDCNFVPGYFQRAKSLFESGEFHFCGGRILPPNPTVPRHGFNTAEAFEVIPPFTVIPAGKIQGANMAVHRKVVDRIGMFDPCIGFGTPFGFEDIDYCARASMAGFTGAFVPDLAVIHQHGFRQGPALERAERDYDFARGAYYAKFILLGRFAYLKYWWERIKWQQRKVSLREMQGAIAYAATTPWASAREWLHRRDRRSLFSR